MGLSRVRDRFSQGFHVSGFIIFFLLSSRTRLKLLSGWYKELNYSAIVQYFTATRKVTESDRVTSFTRCVFKPSSDSAAYNSGDSLEKWLCGSARGKSREEESYSPGGFDRQVAKHRKGPANGVVERVWPLVEEFDYKGEKRRKGLRVKFFSSEYLIIFSIPRGIGGELDQKVASMDVRMGVEMLDNLVSFSQRTREEFDLPSDSTSLRIQWRSIQRQSLVMRSAIGRVFRRWRCCRSLVLRSAIVRSTIGGIFDGFIVAGGAVGPWY